MEDNEDENHRPKVGNSLAIRVPKSIARQAGLKVKDELDIEVRKETLVLRSHLRRVYRLKDLVKRITKIAVSRLDHMAIPLTNLISRFTFYLSRTTEPK